MKRIIIFSSLICFFTFSSTQKGNAQTMGFVFPKGKVKQVIPFKKLNNLTLIPVKINDAITVDFILDTSIEHTIITEKAIGDEANLTYSKKLNMGGTIENPVNAFIASNVKLELTGGLISKFGQSVLVLERDYYNLRSTTGVDIYGIIGFDIFKRFVVYINNSNNTITLYDTKNFQPPKGYTTTPLKVIQSKAYLKTKVTFENWEKPELDLMIDTGANHAILFNGDSSSFLIPTQNLEVIIAKSFKNDIRGFVGRVRHLEFSGFEFENPIATFFGSKEMYLVKESNDNKIGAIGQDILTRFNYVLDFNNEKMYLKKNNSFKNEFAYDMSGLSIVKDFNQNERFVISNIIPNSPASKTKLKIGDIILDLNGEKITSTNFSSIILLLRSKPGKSISIRSIRNGEILKSNFKLYKMI